MTDIGVNLGFSRRDDLNPYPADRHKASAMEQVAHHYAEELDAQFRTLNHFASHSGEIGRAHETYVRAVLQRFIPSRWHLGTGFVVSAAVSPQQDIIVHDHVDHRALFEVGDCVVVDDASVGGVVEVKTKLTSSAELADAFAKLWLGSRFTGMFVWEGASAEVAVEALWAGLRARVPCDCKAQLDWHVPDFVVVRDGYVLLRLDDRPRPVQAEVGLVRLGPQLTNGHALVGLVATLWRRGLVSGRGWESQIPGWLRYWWARFQAAAEPLPTPADLRARTVHSR